MAPYARDETIKAGGENLSQQQSPVDAVVRMHRFRRGPGHSNQLADVLAVESTPFDNDYVDGLKHYVGVSVVLPLCIWMVVWLGVAIWVWKYRWERDERPDVKELTTSKGAWAVSDDESEEIEFASTVDGEEFDFASTSDNEFYDESSSDGSEEFYACNLVSESSIPVGIQVSSNDAPSAKPTTTHQTLRELLNDSTDSATPPSLLNILDDQKRKSVFRKASWISLPRPNISRNKNVLRLKEYGKYVRIWHFYALLSVLIPILTIIMMTAGWNAISAALEEVHHLIRDVEMLAVQGGQALAGLRSSKEWLFKENELVLATVNYQGGPSGNIFVDEWCPEALNYVPTDLLEPFETLTDVTHEIQAVFDDTPIVTQASSAFRNVGEVTDTVDEVLVKFLDHSSWILLLIVLLLNVLNIELLLDICLRYCGGEALVNHPVIQNLYSWFLVPVFFILTLLVVVLLGIAGVVGLVNADFCAGVPALSMGVESPEGTVRNLPGVFGNHGGDSLGDANDIIEYYWTGCLIETSTPPAFVEKMDQLDALFPSDTGSLLPSSQELSLALGVVEHCQNDLSFVQPSIENLLVQVNEMQTQMEQLSNTMSCDAINPLLQRVSQGELCVELPEGLYALWGTGYAICVFCCALLMLRTILSKDQPPPSERLEPLQQVPARESRRQRRRHHKRTSRRDLEVSRHDYLPEGDNPLASYINRTYFDQENLDDDDDDAVSEADKDCLATPTMTTNYRTDDFLHHKYADEDAPYGDWAQSNRSWDTGR